jgi:hypothetical protein
MGKRTFGGEKRDFRPQDQLINLKKPFVVALAEEFGSALRTMHQTGVNHSESVDLTERKSDSRMELLDPIPSPRIKLLKRVYMTLQTLTAGTSRRPVSRLPEFALRPGTVI